MAPDHAAGGEKAGGKVARWGGRNRRQRGEEAEPRNQAGSCRSCSGRWEWGGPCWSAVGLDSWVSVPCIFLQSFLLELLSFFWIFHVTFLLLQHPFLLLLFPVTGGVYLPSQTQGMSSQHVRYSSRDVSENKQSFK